jgi:hypothetical protein
MDPALDLMGMHGLIRHAVRIMKGIRVTLTEDEFDLVVVSVIPLLKVVEKCEPALPPSHHALLPALPRAVVHHIQRLLDD